MKLGFVISTLIAGLLWVSILQLNTSIFTSSGNSNINQQIKIKSSALADVIELDLNRIGYGVEGNGIEAADSNSISFRSNYDNDGIIKNVTWFFTEINQNQRLAVRMIDSVYTDYLIGDMDLKFAYRNQQLQLTQNVEDISHIEMLLLNTAEIGYSETRERHAIHKVISPYNAQF